MPAPLRNSLGNQGSVTVGEGGWKQGEALKWAAGKVNTMVKCSVADEDIDAIALFNADGTVDGIGPGNTSSVQFSPGWCAVKMGAAVTSGKRLKTDASAHFIEVASGDKAGEHAPVTLVADAKDNALGSGFFHGRALSADIA